MLTTTLAIGSPNSMAVVSIVTVTVAPAPFLMSRNVFGPGVKVSPPDVHATNVGVMPVGEICCVVSAALRNGSFGMGWGAPRLTAAGWQMGARERVARS